jgi:high affinity Mn2+ porin
MLWLFLRIKFRNRMKGRIVFAIMLGSLPVTAQFIKDSSIQKNWSLHIQATAIPQYHFNFTASYSGNNSLQTSEGTRVSFTNTYYIGRRLWRNAAVYFNAEIAGGEGLSKATGIAGFPNGETFRIGSAAPKLYVARAYLEQKFPLPGTTELIENDQNQLRQHAAVSYIAIRAGKFSVADFFDDNSYSHDPRTDFMNWSLMSAGAWDYPANTRGYTNGLVIELKKISWALRTGLIQVPEYANGQILDKKIDKAFGSVLEAEKQFHIRATEKIIVRLGGFYNKARMGNYNEAIQEGLAQFLTPDVVATRKYSRSKTGFYINAEHQFKNGGTFYRYSRNDGDNETWAFTEIDRSFSAGLSLNGIAWKRNNDKCGLAYTGNGISKPHRDYLKQGGYGFIIGDGHLNYGIEDIFELFYSYNIARLHLFISPDYQFIIHPAYNKDRGPVHIAALRMHFEL